MDGSSLLDGLAKVLQENPVTSGFLDLRTSYRFLNEAAVEYARHTKTLTASASITTVANQANYDLPVDFYGVFVTDSFQRPVVKYNDGVADSWLTYRPYSAVWFADNSIAVPYPSNFSVIDHQAVLSNLTGTATANGVATNGECTLTDTTLNQFATVNIGDDIHDITDGSGGVVVALGSNSQVVCALFSGTANQWATNDNYVIVPQPRWQIVLDPPPSISGYTVNVFYHARPTPVYSLYRTNRLKPLAETALIYYAAWLYKYRDRDPQFGDAFYRHFQELVGRATNDANRTMDRYSMPVNMTKRSYRDRTYQ